MFTLAAHQGTVPLEPLRQFFSHTLTQVLTYSPQLKGRSSGRREQLIVAAVRLSTPAMEEAPSSPFTPERLRPLMRSATPSLNCQPCPMWPAEMALGLDHGGGGGRVDHRGILGNAADWPAVLAASGLERNVCNMPATVDSAWGLSPLASSLCQGCSSVAGHPQLTHRVGRKQGRKAPLPPLLRCNAARLPGEARPPLFPG